jgi:hypothetical protein
MKRFLISSIFSIILFGTIIIGELATYTTTMAHNHKFYLAFQRSGFQNGTLTLCIDDKHIFQKIVRENYPMKVCDLENLYFLLRELIRK